MEELKDPFKGRNSTPHVKFDDTLDYDERCKHKNTHFCDRHMKQFGNLNPSAYAFSVLSLVDLGAVSEQDLRISKREVRELHADGKGGPYKVDSRPHLKKGLQRNKKRRPSSGGFNASRYR
jgi:hypothetical protein